MKHQAVIGQRLICCFGPRLTNNDSHKEKKKQEILSAFKYPTTLPFKIHRKTTSRKAWPQEKSCHPQRLGEIPYSQLQRFRRIGKGRAFDLKSEGIKCYSGEKKLKHFTVWYVCSVFVVIIFWNVSNAAAFTMPMVIKKWINNEIRHFINYKTAFVIFQIALYRQICHKDEKMMTILCVIKEKT